MTAFFYYIYSLLGRPQHKRGAAPAFTLIFFEKQGEAKPYLALDFCICSCWMCNTKYQEEWKGGEASENLGQLQLIMREFWFWKKYISVHFFHGKASQMTSTIMRYFQKKILRKKQRS